MRRKVLSHSLVALATGTALTLTATPGVAAPAPVPAAPSAAPAQLAATAADQLVDSAAPALHRSAGDTLRRTGVQVGNSGLHYVTYERSYRGLPVVGGDVVVTTDSTGAVRGTAVAQESAIAVDTAPAVSTDRAAATATAQLTKATETTTPRLVVLAWGAPRLTWETVVTGSIGNTPSKLHVFVDAVTGAVADSYDEVRAGTGNSYYNGTVSINTSGSGSSYSMTDTTRSGLRCGGQTGTAYTGTDDTWGNGSGTNLETACVDALYAAQREWDLLGSWFGRNGITGSGGSPPIRVGLNDVNAYWNGSYVNFGHNQANTRQATPIDVVAHELGHAVFQYTPGGAGSGNENGGINESTGDIFGALTEAFANNANDPPDYQVGEEVDLVGDGPIRYMYNPSLAGDPNCWSTSIPNTEVHAAAGPLNHWFYLTAEGSNPGSGKPASPTCNSSTVTGISIRKAGEIYYNALLAKTSSWRYANIRVATLNAAKNLYPGSCTEFNTVKAAWNAISVPAQSSEPTCGTASNDFSISASPTAGSVAPGAVATTTISTAVTAGSAQTVALSATGLPSGTTAAFTPTSVTAGGSSTLRLTTSTSTPAGTYTVTVTGTGSVSHSTSYALTVTGGGGGGCSGTNGTDVAIPDNGAAVTSSITIAGCNRNAGTGSTIAVNIVHTYRGDLVIDLVAPDNSAYRLKNSSSDSADNVNTTYTANLSSEAANGTWRLRVQDVGPIDTGYINTWTLTL
ncbi:M4 family metallopeptidase [Micromonospora sp. NBC_01796]|uniref:M4 family metallopeptidase n=1 Tax=Micromonospora sp. NBC_01796 TaxID=2975987 RepID=UPI002DD9711C|nr:M4 family metallopeptidase [Micromonospora sp. NBC_01796]WSA86275.1 M4 family metallopeptidase [Micromonospora sp. NBC_01796]